jgi:hypothetical protein
MTMTPTAPAANVRSSSATAASAYCHGSDVNQAIRLGRDDRQIDAGLVHVADAGLVIPHFGHQRHERRAVHEDALLPRFRRLAFVLRPAVLVEKFEVRPGKHVGVYVNDSHSSCSARLYLQKNAASISHCGEAEPVLTPAAGS